MDLKTIVWTLFLERYLWKCSYLYCPKNYNIKCKFMIFISFTSCRNQPLIILINWTIMHLCKTFFFRWNYRELWRLFSYKWQSIAPKSLSHANSQTFITPNVGQNWRMPNSRYAHRYGKYRKIVVGLPPPPQLITT